MLSAKLLGKPAYLILAVAALMSANASAHESGDVMLRAGVARVAPDESASPDIISVASNSQIGLSSTYMLTPALGIGLLAATPFEHDVHLKSGGNIAEIRHLPPTVSLQYFFSPAGSLTPYVGVGVNYFMVLDSSMTSAGKKALGTSSISAGDSWGLALSAGLDLELSDNLFLSAGVWNLDIDTTANIGHGITKIDVDVDPWVYMLGVGYKF